MAAVTNTSEQKVILEGVSWETYERLLAEHPDKPGTRFISEQGTKMGRRSILHVQINDESIEVGGYVTPLVEATMRF